MYKSFNGYYQTSANIAITKDLKGLEVIFVQKPKNLLLKRKKIAGNERKTTPKIVHFLDSKQIAL